MPADANIFQQYLQQPKSVLDYQNQYNDADTKRNALQQSVLALQKGQMDMANAADVSRQRNALRDAITSGQIDLSNPDHAPRALALAPDVAPAMLKTVQEGATSRAKAGLDTAQAGHATAQTDAETFKTRVAKSDQAIKDISGFQTPQEALASLEQHASAGDIPPPQAQIIRQQLATMNPAEFPKWQLNMVKNIMSAKDRMEYTAPTANTVANNQTQITTTGMNNATSVKTTGMNNATSVKTTGMNNATSTANTNANIAKDYVIAGVKPDGTPVDGGGLLSPESVINAATRYNMDGTLPPNLGRGTQGPRQTAQILNEAARQAAAKGDSPEAQRIAQLANRANAAAMGTIEKQATMVGAFEKNFSKNADIALELSQKVDRTGVPIVNSWINAGRRAVTGNPDLAAFDANIKATVNEYAKIVGGGSGSGATAQGEISKIEGLLSTAQTPEQVASVISLMKRETANRLQAFEEQKAELRQSMIRPGSAKPAPAAPAAATTAVPPDIANILKKHGGK